MIRTIYVPDTFLYVIVNLISAVVAESINANLIFLALSRTTPSFNSLYCPAVLPSTSNLAFVIVVGMICTLVQSISKFPVYFAMLPSNTAPLYTILLPLSPLPNIAGEVKNSCTSMPSPALVRVNCKTAFFGALIIWNVAPSSYSKWCIFSTLSDATTGVSSSSSGML